MDFILRRKSDTQIKAVATVKMRRKKSIAAEQFVVLTNATIGLSISMKWKLLGICFKCRSELNSGSDCETSKHVGNPQMHKRTIIFCSVYSLSLSLSPPLISSTVTIYATLLSVRCNMFSVHRHQDKTKSSTKRNEHDDNISRLYENVRVYSMAMVVG